MKKVLAIFAIAAILVACNNEGTAEATIDSAANKIDSTAGAAIDSVNKVADTATAKIDSAAKAVVDSLKK